MSGQAQVEQAVQKAVGGKLRFNVVSYAQSLTPDTSESRYGKRPYINFGRNNLFPEFCRSMADNAGPLGSSHNTLSMYVAGQGLEWLNEKLEPVPEAEKRAAKWFAHSSEKKVLQAIGSDIALLQAKAIDIAPSRDGGQKIAAVYHKDVSRIRAFEKVLLPDANENLTWMIPKWAWCADWEEGTRKSWAAILDDPKLKPDVTESFNWKSPSTTDKTTIYDRAYRQNTDYYGVPWWIPALTSTEVWAMVPVFDRTQISTGFRPAFHIHVFSDKDEVDMVQLRKDIKDNLTGANGQAFTLTCGTVAEGAPQITKLERGDHAGELLDLLKRHADVVYEAYGVPKVLMNVEVQTGLSGKGVAIVEEEASFIKRMVEPLQALMTDDFLKLMVEVEGVKEVKYCRVKQNTVFNVKTDPELFRMSYLRGKKVNEWRIEQGMEEDTEVAGKYLIEMGPGQQQQPASNG